MFGLLQQRTWIVQSIALIILCYIVAACSYNFHNRAYLDVDSRFSEPFLREGVYDTETRPSDQKQYRWLAPRSELVFPSISSSAAVIDISLATPQSANVPVMMVVDFSDQASLEIQSDASPRTIHAFVPTSTFNGDARVMLNTLTPLDESSPPYRKLGTVLFDAQIVSVQQSLSAPYAVVLLLFVLGIVWIICLQLIGIRSWVSLFTYSTVLVFIGIGLVQQRSVIVILLTRLVVVGGISIILVWVSKYWLPKLFAKSDVSLTGVPQTAMLLLAFFTFGIKVAGLLHPYMIPIDVEWHMDKVRWIFEGRISSLYGGGLNQLVMPVEWGAEKPIIPYSPMYHFFASWFTFLPWKANLTAIVLNAITDTSYLFMIYFLTRKVGASAWAGIIAALVYATTPSTYLLHSWGNVPTTFGMWWTLLVITWIVGVWDQIPKTTNMWWSLTLIFAAAFVFYTVMGVFLAMFLIVFLTAMVCIRSQRQHALFVLKSALTGFAIATGLFYWQYIIPTIRQTLPLISQRVAQGGQNLGEVERPFIEYVFEQLYLWDIYSVYIPLMLGIIGWIVMVRYFGRLSMITWLFVAWIIVAVLWWFAGYKVDTVDKQLFWLIPAMAVGTGFLYDRVRRNPRLATPFTMLLVILFIYQFSDAMYLWFYRIKYVQGFTSIVQETLRWLGFKVREARS